MLFLEIIAFSLVTWLYRSYRPTSIGRCSHSCNTLSRGVSFWAQETTVASSSRARNHSPLASSSFDFQKLFGILCSRRRQLQSFFWCRQSHCHQHSSSNQLIFIYALFPLGMPTISTLSEPIFLA